MLKCFVLPIFLISQFISLDDYVWKMCVCIWSTRVPPSNKLDSLFLTHSHIHLDIECVYYRQLKRIVHLYNMYEVNFGQSYNLVASEKYNRIILWYTTNPYDNIQNMTTFFFAFCLSQFHVQLSLVLLACVYNLS